ncbi:sporulation protein [Robertmurraya yapensis]|uniref:Sporulation protein n=1 Tax=Bacillus yapensis TaxID=2492960 RepID=A0A3S0KEN9_9BACI|nr:sporulation protein [Bacillus yapensis]RTR29114.1 sporulation protein [Bacillus yapensis]TKS94719.1 sporulation protein [Bacillus yapensis]
MLLRKFMSLVGIGSAKIDLILDKETYTQGEQITGYFLLKGGLIEQQLKRIDCDLVKVENGTESMIEATSILTSRSIESEAANKIPFSFKLPTSLPISTEDISYRFKTRLTFTEGVESVDQDIIQVVEGERLA